MTCSLPEYFLFLPFISLAAGFSGLSIGTAGGIIVSQAIRLLSSVPVAIAACGVTGTVSNFLVARFNVDWLIILVSGVMIFMGTACFAFSRTQENRGRIKNNLTPECQELRFIYSDNAQNQEREYCPTGLFGVRVPCLSREYSQARSKMAAELSITSL